jgi:RHS repeat-associated protein
VILVAVDHIPIAPPGESNCISVEQEYNAPESLSCHSPVHVSDASVVHAFLNARYYDGSRGQFTSQDPVFLGNPTQQNLSAPQSLNAYSYSEDNPIIKSDPTGNQFCEAACLDDIAIALAIQFARNYCVNLAIGLAMEINAHSIPSNLVQPPILNSNSSIQFSPTLSTPLTIQDYENVAKDQVLPSLLPPVGGEAAEGLFGPGKKLVGSLAAVGAGSVVQGEFQRGVTGQSQPQIMAGALINMGGDLAANHIVGNVRGPDVQSFNSRFITGAHTQNAVANSVVSQSLVSTVGQPAQAALSLALGQLFGALSALSSIFSVQNAR